MRMRLRLLTLVMPVVIACESATSASNASLTATPAPPTGVPEPTVAPPTPAPPPTVVLPDGSFATATPVTPDPVYATQEAALQATIAAAQATAVARATASPFPTAGPPIIHIGQPALAVKERDGLSFAAQLPTDTYLAGEGGLADITLHNDSPETFVFQDARVVLLDEQGHEPDAWPWSPMTFLGRFRRGGLGHLVPGGELTHTLRFQVPPADQATGHTYTLWVETEFSRALPGYPEGWDNIWLRLETGPIPVKVIAPNSAQQLAAELQVDWNGWQLRVADATGQVPPEPVWGEIEAALPNGAMAGPLQDSADGSWSGSWESHRLTPGEGIIVVRAWVAVPGYAIAPVIQVVPQDTPREEIHRRLAAFEPPTRQRFGSIEEARAALGVPFYAPRQLPPGTTLKTITIETGLPDPTLRLRVRGMYRLADGRWLELIQMVTSEGADYAGWGQVRYTSEARTVAVNGATGFVGQPFGWWLLDWKAAGTGFELRAPATAFSLDELLAIAATVQPLE